MKLRSKGWIVAFALGAGLMLTAAGCGGGGTTGGGGTSGAVPVSLKEYSVTVGGTTLSKGSSTTMKAGAVTFHVVNDGTMAHDFSINGPGVSNQATKQLDPKGTQDLSVTLQAGDYEVWCSVPGHKELGMDGHIKVS